MQSNEPLPANIMSRINERGELSNSSSNVNENLTLNNLVGGTSSLLELKFGGHSASKVVQNHSPKMALSTLVAKKSFNEGTSNSSKFSSLQTKGQNISSSPSIGMNSSEVNSLDHDDILLIDTSKDRKELETEFDQVSLTLHSLLLSFLVVLIPVTSLSLPKAFKKMNRVKDNYKTHMKFMDIVKS